MGTSSYPLVSHLTSKFQATIPRMVRDRLGLKYGDGVAFVVEGERVVVKRAGPLDMEFARSLQNTLSEWESENDERAYRDL